MKDHYEERRRSKWRRYAIVSLIGEGPFQEDSGIDTEFKGTVSLLNEFYIKGNLNQLWQEVEPEYRAHVETVLSQVSKAGGDVSAYLRQPLPSGYTFYYVPNWLHDYGYGGYNRYGSEVFITLSPQYDALLFTEKIRHEFLHDALDAALEKNAAAIEAKEYLFQQVSQDFWQYGTWSSFVEESLIRAITIRMAAAYEPAWQSGEWADSVLHHFFLIEPFLEALKDFEAGSGTFDQYSPRILQAIP